MKKIFIKKAMRALSVLLCVAMTVGIMPVISIAEVTEKTLLDISNNMSYLKNSSNNHEISQGENLVEHADYTYSTLCSMTDNQYYIYQTTSSAYQQRLLVRNPSSIALNGVIEAEARFKIKAGVNKNAKDLGNLSDYQSDYSKSLPNISFMWFWRGVDMYLQTTSYAALSPETEDIWQTIKYTIDTKTRTVTGYLNGNQVCRGSYKSELTEMDGDFGFMLVAQNSGESNAEKQDLITPVTWTFDSFKVKQTADFDAEPTPTTPGSDPAGVKTLLLIDDNITVAKNNGGQHDILQDGAKFEHADWNRIIDDTDDKLINQESNKEVVLRQLKSSGWQYRWLLKSPTDIPLEGTIEFETRFKVKADDYTKAVPKVMFIGFWRDANMYLNSANVTVSEQMQDQWQTLKYVIDTDAKTVTAYVNDVKGGSVSYNNLTTISGDFGILPHVQNQGESGVEKNELKTPITWTIDYFKITQTVEEEEKPVVKGETLMNIDDNMSMADNDRWQKNISQGTGTIEHIDWAGATKSRVISADKGSFVVNQIKSSENNQRIYVKKPEDVDIDGTVEFETRFMISASDYSKAPNVYLMFHWEKAGMFLATAKLNMSEAMADKWQTVKYVIDPETHTVTAYLNGVKSSSAAYNNSLTALTGNFGLEVSVQNQGETRKEGSELQSDVTWTYDYFKLTKNGGEGEAEPTPPPPPYTQIKTGVLVDIDKNTTLSGNNLSENGTVAHYFWPADKEYTRTLEDSDRLVVRQGVSTAYQQRFMITEPDRLILDNYAILEAKFKLAADKYDVSLPKVKFMFVKLKSNDDDWQTFNDMGISASLSPETEDMWQTLRYEIDYENLVITGYLNGEKAVTINMPAGTEKLDNFGFFPVVQNEGKNNADAETLTTPITITYDSIRLEKVDSFDQEVGGLAAPLAEPVSSGAWSSEYYRNGVGRDDYLQLSGKAVNLGKRASINKVVIDHDPSKIMSFSVQVSENGLSYTPVTEIYAGGVDAYSGRQVYRFAPVNAQFVKYEAVLLGEYETQAKLNDMTVSYVDTDSIDLSDLPDSINLNDYDEVKLTAYCSDSDGSYKMSNRGVVWSADGAEVREHTLYLDDAEEGVITVTAADASGACTASKQIKLTKGAAVRNLALYADAAHKNPLKSASGTAYIGGELLGTDKATMNLAAYDSDKLIGVETIEVAKGTIAASSKIPDGAEYVKLFVWNDDMTPVEKSVGTNGATAANLYLIKDDTAVIAADGSLEVDDSYVAEVTADGTVTAKHEGSTVIYVKKDGNIVEKINVRVEATMYVYLLMGQSNMAGTNSPKTEGVDIPISDNVKLLNKSNVFEDATHPYCQHSGVNYIGDTHPIIGFSDIYSKEGINMGYSFSEKLAKQYPDKQIGLIVNSSSGCSILTYERNAKEQGAVLANGFENTVARTKAATKNGAQLMGIIWHQGESDQNDTTYPARLRNLMYDLRNEISEPEVPLIAGGLSETQRSTAPYNGRLKNEQNHIANLGYVSVTEPEPIISRAEIKDENGNLYYPASAEDFTHFSAHGQIVFGHRYYDVYTKLTERIKR